MRTSCIQYCMIAIYALLSSPETDLIFLRSAAEDLGSFFRVSNLFV